MSPLSRTLLLVTSALVPIGIGAADANPVGPKVKAGGVTISGEGTANVRIDQSTSKAIINWKTFDIGNGERTRFLQPDKDSVTLNRVTGGLGASTINGVLKANGNIFLINPDGILFGRNSIIDTGGLLATTSDITDDNFLAGKYRFNIPGKADASIVNLGTITAKSGGFAALVAPGVRNGGIITARLGDVTLSSANRFTLDFYGDRLITLSVSDETAGIVRDVHTGQPLDALVKNTGKIKADGGTVQLTAVAARKVVDAVINNTGVIEANSVGIRNGKIVLGAATARAKPAGAPVQTVKVSGTLSAAGKQSGTTGGKIEITGEAIKVASATIDASGRSGGGTVLIGGDVSGGHLDPSIVPIQRARPERDPVATATTVSVDAATTIDASATADGDGGKVILWSNGLLDYRGSIYATGGALSGNGGFVETSGAERLQVSGAVDASSTFGVSGTWLLDPKYLYITDASSYNKGLSRGTNVTIRASRKLILYDDIVKNGATRTVTLKLVSPFIYQVEGINVLSRTGSLNVIYDASDRIWFGRGRPGAESTIKTNGGNVSLLGDHFVGINGEIDAGYGTVLIRANRPRSTDIDRGIRIVSGSRIEAADIDIDSSYVRIEKNVTLLDDDTRGVPDLQLVEIDSGVITPTDTVSHPIMGGTVPVWVTGYSFGLLDQKDTSDASLYISPEWAATEINGIPRWKDTCLAAVYAMIQAARGIQYKIGQVGSWTDKYGAEPIAGTSRDSTVLRSIDKLYTELANGNPVILRTSALSGQHFVLAVGVNSSGEIVALDPWGGKKIEIDPTTWIAKNSDAGQKIEVLDMRTVII